MFGEVTEWSKVLAWKVSVPQKGTGGSNPFLSAEDIALTQGQRKYGWQSGFL